MTDRVPEPGEIPDAGEEAAWAELVARWDDPLAHRAFLDRCHDLGALSQAGARYRAVLSGRPGDPAAAAGRDEVVRRATILGLASMPRTPVPAAAVPWVRPAVYVGVAVTLLALAGAVVVGFLRSGVLR